VEARYEVTPLASSTSVIVSPSSVTGYEPLKKQASKLEMMMKMKKQNMLEYLII